MPSAFFIHRYKGWRRCARRRAIRSINDLCSCGCLFSHTPKSARGLWMPRSLQASAWNVLIVECMTMIETRGPGERSTGHCSYGVREVRFNINIQFQVETQWFAQPLHHHQASSSLYCTVCINVTLSSKHSSLTFLCSLLVLSLSLSNKLSLSVHLMGVIHTSWHWK